MKSFAFGVIFLLLHFVFMVSSQSYPEEILTLIDEGAKARTLAENKVLIKYDEILQELKNQLNDNIIPSLTEMYKDLENQIENMENKTSSSGYDTSSCLIPIKDALAAGLISNIVKKASQEMTDIYEVIVSNILRAEKRNLEVISKEVDSVVSEYTACINSAAPSYCTYGVLIKAVAKQEEIPLSLRKEVERATLALTQVVRSYENKAHDYVREVSIATKPYLALLESCLSVIFVG